MARLWLISDYDDWAAAALRRAGHIVEVLDVDDARARIAMDEEEEPDLYVVDLSAQDACDLLTDDIPQAWVLCLGREAPGAAGYFLDALLGSLYGRGAAMVPNGPGHEWELRGAVALQLERAGKAGEP